MSQVAEKIAAEIALRGAIPFARFMELALYCPVYGYYEREKDTLGRRGDYYTSVSVGNLFGQLLGWQFAEWLSEGGVRNAQYGIKPDQSTGHSPQSSVLSPQSMGRGQEPGRGAMAQIVEAGAHDGTLAKDILAWMQVYRKELWGTLEYIIVDPSQRRQEWQKQTLAEFQPRVRWVRELAELAPTPHSAFPTPQSIIFSNELLDAMPVHRLGWDAQRQDWFEWGVTLQNGHFAWTRLPAPHDPRLTPLAPLPAALLPDGYSIEVCPAAQEWWRQAAAVLGSGKLVALDYGLTEEELWVPERTSGTLRAYHRHQSSADLLALPGEQDLTAHVNFTALQAAGEAAGLKTEDLVTQGQFLTRIAAKVLDNAAGFGSWTRQHTRQFQTLTHPEHLGRAFRVLVQGRLCSSSSSSSSS